MLSLGRIRILRTAFRGTGPLSMLPGEWDGICECAVLVDGGGWVPCDREASEVEREIRGKA